MNTIVPSKYNIFVEDDKEYILYNSLSGQITIINEADRALVKEAMITPSLQNEYTQYLVQSGYLIHEDTSEVEAVTQIVKATVEKDELFLMLLPTERCNFRCAYCYEDFLRPSMSMEVARSIIAFVERTISQYKSLHVEWYGGEPMLSMDIIEYLSGEFIEICRKNHKPYFSMMTTNGFFLTPENIKRLHKARVTGYQISIDGLAITHDQQRYLANGAPTWQTIIDNLRYIRDHIKSRSFNVMIRTNLTRAIYEISDDYFSFFSREFGSDKRFTHFLHLAQDWGNIQDETIIEQFCNTEEFYATLDKAITYGVSTKLFYNFLQPGTRICYAAKKNHYMIRPDGAVGRCTGRLNEANQFFCNIDDVQNHPFSWEAIQQPPASCEECKKLPLCYGLVCPFYEGNVQDTCGYELSDINRLLKIIAHTDNRCARPQFPKG